MKQLALTDAIRNVNVQDFIKHHLQKTIVDCGGQEAFQQDWLVNVDRDVVNDFSKLGIF